MVLCNTSVDIEDIWQHLLDSRYPLMKPPVARREIAVVPKVLASYTGNYQLAPSFFIEVTREGGRLFLQATRQSNFESFTSSLSPVS